MTTEPKRYTTENPLKILSLGWGVQSWTLAAMADRMGDRLASRLYAGNPNLPEVSVVVNTAEDYRA